MPNFLDCLHNFSEDRIIPLFLVLSIELQKEQNFLISCIVYRTALKTELFKYFLYCSQKFTQDKIIPYFLYCLQTFSQDSNNAY